MSRCLDVSFELGISMTGGVPVDLLTVTVPVSLTQPILVVKIKPSAESPTNVRDRLIHLFLSSEQDDPRTSFGGDR